MKTKATINLMTPTTTGINQATGNPWSKKEVVFEIAREDGKADTLVASTMNTKIIAQLDNLSEGDEVEVTLGTQARAKMFTRKDGTEGCFRSTDIFILSINTDNTVF